MTGFSPEEKREVFDRLITIEGDLKHVCRTLDNLPCEGHSVKMNKLALKQESSKLSILTLVFSALFSLASFIGVLYGFSNSK